MPYILGGEGPDIPERRWTEIAGESNYQAEIAAVAGPKDEFPKDNRVLGVLVPEPDNDYDPNAVAVTIEGDTVGYLHRRMAARWQARTLELQEEHGPVHCHARILGGWDRGHGDEGFFGVKIYLGEHTPTRGEAPPPPPAPPPAWHYRVEAFAIADRWSTKRQTEEVQAF